MRFVACAVTLGAMLTRLAGAPSALAEPPPKPSILYIQPMGRALPKVDVRLVRQSLQTFFGVEVRVLRRVKLPRSAWYRPRKRWRAEKLLDFLRPRLPKDGFRILGLTAADISTTKGEHKDWGVLGLATLDGVACVISKFRARRRSKSRLHARQRLAKVAVHEIGHTLGLDHCPSQGCLMEDARGSVLTTDGERDLCARCRARLKKSGRVIPDSPVIPW